TASVTPPPGASDPSSANYTDSDQLTPQADVAVTKTGPAFAVPGTPLSYTITVTNNGPSNAQAVIVNDPAPSGSTFRSNTGDCATAFPCTLGTLAPHATRPITPSFDLPPAFTGPLPIVNTVTATTATPDTNTANNSSTVQTPLNRDADVEITQTIAPASVPLGGTATLTVTAVNHGPNSASG